MKNYLFILLFCSIAGCASIADKEMSAASSLVGTEVQSAEDVICKLVPISIWQIRYGNTPARAAGWSAICNAPSLTPVMP